MRAVDVIIRKRNHHALTSAEIDAFIAGITTGAWPDYQTSALLMAIMLNGMNATETWHLTTAMLHSGSDLDLSDVPGPKVGKHSTGGVGDKVSIVLAPLAAACGVTMPKMSGRGLGHTGGTLDKLESIPGFRVDLSIDEFKRVLKAVGACIVGQTATLVPADKKIYGLRDVTATVESIPLICASIMSKKMAEGSDALVLDVKCGSGAVMKDLHRARTLAESMVAIGHRAGLPTEAIITDMDAPLGAAVGNALEVIECIETLKGQGPDDLLQIVRRLAARVVILAGVARDDASADATVSAALTSGRALETLRRMIEAQGGDPAVVDDYSRLPSVEGRVPLTADRSGYVTRIRAGEVGLASNLLGAGRARVEASIDHGVGILIRARCGDPVRPGETLLELRHRDGLGVDGALALCRSAVEIGDAPPPARPNILGRSAMSAMSRRAMKARPTRSPWREPSWFACVVVVALLSAGCGRASYGAEDTSRTRVGIVFDIGGKDDRSFNAAAWAGVRCAETGQTPDGHDCGKPPLDIVLHDVEPGTPTAIEPAMRAFAERGYDLILGIGFAQAPIMEIVARDYPNIHFGIVDGVSDLPNVASLVFKEHEGSYLVGMIAARTSKTGTIGFLGGMDIGLIHRFEKGYEEGARAVNPRIKLVQNYVGVTDAAWNNPGKGKEIALAQIGKGADVIFTAAGNSGLGAFDAVEQAGTENGRARRFVIGVDSNQNMVKPGFVLTSMVKRVDNAVYDIVKDVAQKRFNAGLHVFGLESDGVAYAMDQYNTPLISDTTLQEVEAAKKKIIGGQIKVTDAMFQ